MDDISEYLAKADDWAKRALTAAAETERDACRAVEQSYRDLARALSRMAVRDAGRDGEAG
jgi:hypothetical protein